MTLETIYYITQIIAVLAILASLIAIISEQRRTNQIERGKTESERANQLSEHVWNVTRDEDTLHSIRICLLEHDTAHPNDQAKFMAYMTNVMEIAGQAFYQNKNGLIAPSSFVGVFNYCIANLRMPGGRQWWEVVGVSTWQADIVAYVNERLENTEDGIPPITDIFPYLRLPKDEVAVRENPLNEETPEPISHQD